MKWFSFVIVFLLSATQVSAMTVVRLGKPATPTNDSSVVLSYTALSSTSEPLALVCEAKPPGQSDFGAFFSTTLIPGGNSGTCTYVFGGAGEYRFRVKATDGSSTVYSDTVSVATGNAVSGVESWSSNKVGCEYRLSFKLPSDPSVARVEVYRSQTDDINTNAATKVLDRSVSPGDTIEHTDTPPTCDTYVYAARVIALSGASSGLSGDSVSLAAPTTPASPAPVTLASQTPPRNPQPTSEPLVEITPLASPVPVATPEGSVAPAPTPGAVLGSIDDAMPSKGLRSLPWMVIGLAALAFTGMSGGVAVWWLNRYER